MIKNYFPYYFASCIIRIYCLFTVFASTAQICDEPILMEQFNKIKHDYEINEMEQIPELADSLIKYFATPHLIPCKEYFWVRFYKTEVIRHDDEFDQALSLFYELLDEVLQNKYYDIASQINLSIALIYEMVERPKDCRYHLSKAKHIIDMHSELNVLPRYLVRYSSYQRLYGNRDTAVFYASQAIKLGKEQSDLQSQTDGNLLLGILSTNFIDKERYFNEAIRMFLSAGNLANAATQEINMASIFIELKNNEKAMFYLDQAFSHVDTAVGRSRYQTYILSQIFDYKRKIYADQEEYDLAYVALMGRTKYDKLLDNKINQAKINELQIKYAEEKSTAILIRTRWIVFLVSMGMLSLVIFAFVLLRIQKKLKETNNTIIEQNTTIQKVNRDLNMLLRKQNILMTEIHHRVKNNLQFVIGLLDLYSAKTKENSLKIKLNEISQKVMSIATIHDQLYRTKENSKLDIKIYLEELATHFSSILPKDAFISISSKSFLLNLDSILPLAILCSELITNSSKYAVIPNQKLVCTITITRKLSNYTLLYRDNGPGYKLDSIGNKSDKMGMLLIDSMVKQLNASSKTSVDNGVLFEMVFKEKEQPELEL